METWEILMPPQDENTHTLAHNLLVTYMKCLYLVGGTPYHTTHLIESYTPNTKCFPNHLRRFVHKYTMVYCKEQQKKDPHFPSHYI
jgi:hypothetical protein